MNKYGNIRTGGYSSKLEAAVAQMLHFRENAGEIQVLGTQDNVHLTAARVLYIPDFKCLDVKTQTEFWVEAKGFESPRWPTIKKLWKFYGPGELHIYKGTYRHPVLTEVIKPRGTNERD
jgi:hypothetical protein